LPRFGEAIFCCLEGFSSTVTGYPSVAVVQPAVAARWLCGRCRSRSPTGVAEASLNVPFDGGGGDPSGPPIAKRLELAGVQKVVEAFVAAVAEHAASGARPHKKA